MTNGAQRTNRPLLLIASFVLFATTLSGCIGELRDYYSFEPEEQYVNPGVFPGEYRTAEDGTGSTVLRPGRPYYGDPEIYRLTSSTPHSVVAGQPEMPAESIVYITVAAWVPTNGIDARVPVILVASPSFEIENRTMLGAEDHPTVSWLLRNYFPLGYAVAAVSVRGTGTSGGCMELLGPREVGDLNQAVRFLATQEWSNGNVAMFGANYEGAAALAVAASGNEFLRTIVPVSGWSDTFGLLFHNGTVASNAALFHPSLWSAGVGHDNNPPPRPTEVPEPGFPVPTGAWLPRPFAANGREPYQDRQNVLCDEAYHGFASGAVSAVTGERDAANLGFWAQRDFREGLLSDYDGSIFLIHGLQDWNTDPRASIPFNQELADAGIELKQWFGQWGSGSCFSFAPIWFSMPCAWDSGFTRTPEWQGQTRSDMPDTRCPKSSAAWRTTPCRLDFAETLLHWFDRHLKENATTDVGPRIQVQDNRGYWRNVDDYPPRDATWLEFHLNGDGTIRADASAETILRLAPPLEYGPIRSGSPPRNIIELKTDPFLEDTRVSGLPQVHVSYETDGPGGLLAAWLFDEDESGKVFAPDPRSYAVGHGEIDLRFRDGSSTATPNVPGQRYTARMQLEPLDILVPKGHRLTLWLLQYPYANDDPATVPSAIDVVLGEPSVIRLPTIVVPWDSVFPVPGAHFPSPQHYGYSHVRKPDYAEISAGPLQAQDLAARCFEAAWLPGTEETFPSVCRRWLER